MDKEGSNRIIINFNWDFHPYDMEEAVQQMSFTTAWKSKVTLEEMIRINRMGGEEE